MCVSTHSEQRQKGSRVQLHFWDIGSYPLGLSLVAFQHQQVICRAGWKQEVGCVWWRQLVGGIVWLLLLLFLRSHHLPGPCQSPSRGPKMRREKNQELSSLCRFFYAFSIPLLMHSDMTLLCDLFVLNSYTPQPTHMHCHHFSWLKNSPMLTCINIPLP